jgi:hypothetical protein
MSMARTVTDLSSILSNKASSGPGWQTGTGQVTRISGFEAGPRVSIALFFHHLPGRRAGRVTGRGRSRHRNA